MSLAETIEAPWPTLFHDLAITENHILVPLGSAIYNADIAMGNTRQVWDCLELDPTLNMRLGVRGRSIFMETGLVISYGAFLTDTSIFYGINERAF